MHNPLQSWRKDTQGAIEFIQRGKNFHERSFDHKTTDDDLHRVIYQSSVWIAQKILLLSEAGAQTS
jgi:hypothetical protein